MKNNSLLSLLLIVTTAFLNTQCAVVIPPTGGPKDQNAPIIKKITPAPGNTNFKGGSVFVEFDEEIIADPNTNNIIVSPSIEGKIELKEKKKKYLEIVIPKNLRENTTYSISLNNSVKDITESNILNNVTYAFSTGPVLDSLSISGTTLNIETKQPIKDVLIGLYEKSDTLNIGKQKPLYLTYSNQEGQFQLLYLKEGSYFLLALEDKNKNLLFDNQEKTDFIETINVSSSDFKPISLQLSVSDTSGNKLLTKKPGYFKQELSYRNGIQSFSYTNLNSDDKLYILQDKKKAKDLTVYTSAFTQDSLSYILHTTDSLGNKLSDTLKIDLQKKPTTAQTPSILPLTKDIIPGNKRIIFTTNKPIHRYLIDSISINNLLPTIQPTITSNGDSVIVELSKEELKLDTLKVNFRTGSFIYYDGDSLKNTSFNFTKADPANYSSMEMKIQTKEESYIIQLLTENYTIIDEFKNITILNYDYIIPGTYRIRAIVDRNKNNRWDRANPSQNIKAESIYYFNNDKINLKPNWELRDLMFIF